MKVRKSEIKKAIIDSGGIILTIAKRLKIEWHTASKYIESDKALKDMLEIEREKFVDIAETQVLKKVANGESDMIKWYLAHKAKDRGYGDKLEVRQTNLNIDLSVLNKQQLQALADGQPLEKVLNDI